MYLPKNESSCYGDALQQQRAGYNMYFYALMGSDIKHTYLADGLMFAEKKNSMPSQSLRPIFDIGIFFITQ